MKERLQEKARNQYRNLLEEVKKRENTVEANIKICLKKIKETKSKKNGFITNLFLLLIE